jgi:hypothetical protein
MVTPSGKMTHGCALRLLEANPPIHPEPRGQHSRYPDEFPGEIDASHPTALVPGEVARRTSDPRSDLEQMAGLEATSPQAPRGECRAASCRAVKAQPRRVAGIFDGVIDFDAVTSQRPEN